MQAEQTEKQAAPFPWVCALLIASASLLFALKFYVLVRFPPKTIVDQLAITLRFGALYAPSVRDGQWWRLVSYAFAHGSVMHLLFNMLATSALGVPLERKIGTAKFIQLSLVTCLGAAAVVLLVPHHPPLPTVGASGIIFGWAAALMFLLGKAQVRELGKMMLLNAAISLLPGVSWQGHLGGFLFGLPCGFILRRNPDSFSARAPILCAIAGGIALFAVYRT
jgi:rhomboid protease GluP